MQNGSVVPDIRVTAHSAGVYLTCTQAISFTGLGGDRTITTKRGRPQPP
ncbi:MAG: hypothetical protein AAFZ17_08355 [Cyanobacteria bacterium J06650_10]